jgi:exopolysaccharide biosynthesis polyprenyl glycosylphosphotransferase
MFNLSWLASTFMTSLYQSRQWLDFNEFLKMTLKTFLLSSFIVFMFVFGYKYEFSRLFIFSTVALFGAMLVLNRIFFHFLILTTKSNFTRKVVIIGNNETSEKLMNYFRDETRLVDVVGCFDDSMDRGAFANTAEVDVRNEYRHRQDAMRAVLPQRGPGMIPQYAAEQAASFANSIQQFIAGFRNDDYDTENDSSVYREPSFFTGKIGDCLGFVKEHGVSEIYCTLSPETNPGLYDLAYKAEERFVHFKFVPDYSHFARKSILVDYVEDLPLLSLRRQPLEDVSNRILKRALDLVFSLLVIVFILSWLTPLLALLIKLDSKGPVFFLQLRSGKNNKPFWCIKFRTLKENEEADRKQVTKNDDRITRLGRVLRKTNIDELPQFLNVFIGNMSVVGPRPHMLKHTKEFNALHKQYMIRHFVKPGVTGLAQVNGYRGEIRHPELLKKRVEYDIMYLENWSLAEDIRIIASTLLISFTGDENAY